MFTNLQETIKALNADVKNVANCEKAKKLRKKLLKIGLPMMIIGYSAMFACFAWFAIAGVHASGLSGILPPFLLFLPCAVVGSIGARITSLAMKIIITGYTTDLINETVGNNCPRCGETVGSEMLFCPKCGEKLSKECPNCKHANSHKHSFCEQCGTKLE